MHNHDEVCKKRKTQQIDDVDSFYRWAELPYGPLVEIAERLSNFEDFEALHFVCRRWYSVLRASHCKFLNGGHVGHCSPQVPWLMMADHERAESNLPCSLRPCSTKGNTMRLFFYRLSFDRVCQMLISLPPQLDIDQGNFDNCRLWSSHGWFFIVTKGLTMSLYNPLCGPTNNYIPLPRNDALAAHVKRFALSACPCTNSYTVVLASSEMAFWRPGDEDWTFVKPHRGNFGSPLDVTFYQGHYFAVGNIGEIYMISNDDDNPRKKYQSRNLGTLFPMCAFPYLWKAYFVFVESSNKLLVVVRVALQPRLLPVLVSNRDHLTAGFRVMEICVPPTPMVEDDFEPAKEVNNLGNISLFVGRNQAFAVEVPHSEEGVNVSPSYYGCKPNCIYFTDDRLCNRPITADWGKGKDLGVYNMADGTIARHFQGLSLGDYSPMMWV